VKRVGCALAATAVLLMAACSSKGGSEHQTVTVFAAASLTEAFQAIGRSFERRRDGMTLRFDFGPSDGLAQQIQQGAPADVFASASESWMDAVARDPGVTARTDFVRNRLTVVVPGENPARITGISDLARPGVKVVLAATGVPAGDYARQILANAGIANHALANLVSNEVDVKGVLAKITTGEADAGIVYVTDVTPDVAPKVEAIPIPARDNVVATYPIAVIRGRAARGPSTAFVRYVLGPGQVVLRRLGFLPA
jgi:molybdate transport system substrate-binding protein